MIFNIIKMKGTLLTLIFSLTAVLRPSSAFFLVDTCPMPPPCTCYGRSEIYINIRCDRKRLTNIPHIKQSIFHVNKINLDFDSNKLTVIHNNAFIILNLINASDIDLQLAINNIHTIENYAFKGIENVTTSLQLQNNNLTAIPFAIRNLVNLRSLDVRGNSLYTLDASVMSSIGSSLTSFSFDLNYFTEWPKELHNLRVLQTLAANQIPFPHLDINAFHGFETTLTSLTLDQSNLEKVPYAICQLGNLSSLFFTRDSYLNENESSIFEHCHRNLSTVTTLALVGNNIHTFPNIFTLFPSLTLLDLELNKIEYIESAKIPFGLKLPYINLENNRFERIPYALNRLTHLNEMYLSRNKIKTIDTTDLEKLSSLIRLEIAYNPILYVAPNAFNNNAEITYLNLHSTQLDHVPVAITNLTKLSHLSLSGMSIDCSCDMSYLKHWNVSAITYFNSKCDSSSSETVKTFIMNSLQSCP